MGTLSGINTDLNKKFVARIRANDNPKVKNAYENLRAVIEHTNDEIKNIKHQVDALMDDRAIHWKALWAELQEAGAVPKELTYNDHLMQLEGDKKDATILITRKDSDDLPDFIKAMLTQAFSAKEHDPDCPIGQLLQGDKPGPDETVH